MYNTPRLSSDGRRLAFFDVTSSGEYDVWTARSCRLGSRAEVLVTYSHAQHKVVEAWSAQCEQISQTRADW